MLSHEADALRAQRAVYGRPVAYQGAGLDGTTPITAIRSDTRGETFSGLEGRTNSLTFEIDKADLPADPDKDNLITEENGAQWLVIDIGDRDDIEAWVLGVEEAPTP
jgi:hypothetical protein